MKKIVIASVLTAFLVPAAGSGFAANKGSSKFAPGHQQTYPGQAKKFAPGHLQQSPGDAKNFAPGRRSR